jgi:ketol-acid reductoisomerase
MYQGGLNYMRYSVSDTAEYGDYVAGARVINAESRQAMQQLLAEVRDGSFARNWIAENERGRTAFYTYRAQDIEHPLERIGQTLRRMMPFVEPKEVRPGGSAAAEDSI